MLTYDKLCPDCGAAMILRTNKKTDERFWGCSFYPECTGTRQAEGDSDSANEDAPAELASERLRRNDRNRWRNE